MRCKRTMLDYDGLRRARRAGRIDHVRRRARMDNSVFKRALFTRYFEALRETGTHRIVRRWIDDAVRKTRILRDPVEARGRMTRIERHEHAARLQHREQRDEEFARALDTDADPHLRRYPRRAQLLRRCDARASSSPRESLLSPRVNEASAGASGLRRASARSRRCNAVGKLVMSMKSFGAGRFGQSRGRRNCGFIGMTNRAKKFLPPLVHFS